MGRNKNKKRSKSSSEEKVIQRSEFQNPLLEIENPKFAKIQKVILGKEELMILLHRRFLSNVK